MESVIWVVVMLYLHLHNELIYRRLIVKLKVTFRDRCYLCVRNLIFFGIIWKILGIRWYIDQNNNLLSHLRCTLDIGIIFLLLDTFQNSCKLYLCPFILKNIIHLFIYRGGCSFSVAPIDLSGMHVFLSGNRHDGGHIHGDSSGDGSGEVED